MSIDTDPRIQRMLIEGFRRMSPQEKLDRCFSMTRAILDLARSDLRRRFPSADAGELRLRLASRWLDPDLMRRAFGWDPRQKG